MFKHERVAAIRQMRGTMWSPGRPSIARREDRVWFWRAIARGVSPDVTVDDALAVQALIEISSLIGAMPDRVRRSADGYINRDYLNAAKQDVAATGSL